MIKTLLAVILSILPLYVVRFSIFEIPTTLLEVSIFVVFGLWLLLKIFRRESIVEVLNFKFFWFGVVFILIGIFETSVSADKRGGLGILKAYFLDPFLVYLVLTDVLRKEKSVFWIIGSLTVAGLFLSLISFFQYITSWNPFAPHEVALGRVTGVFNTGNALGLFLGPLVALYIERFIDSQKNGNRLKSFMYLGIILVWVITIFMSKSRGSLIALVGVLLFYLFVLLLEKRLKTSQILFFVTFITISGLILAGVLIFNKYSGVFSSTVSYNGSDTLKIRLFIWSGTKRLLSDHPVKGAGLNGFKSLYENAYLPKQFTEPVQYPHNLFLTFWAELGILGLFVFIVFILLAIKQVFSKNRINKLPRANVRGIPAKQDSLFSLASSTDLRPWHSQIENKSLWFMGWGIFATFYYYFLHGIVDVPYFKNDLSVLMWVLVSLAESSNIILRGKA